MAVFNVDYSNFTFRGQAARIQAAVDLSINYGPAQLPIPDEILGIPDYLGCFRVAETPNHKSGSQFAYGGITGRKVGGQVRLFYTGNEPSEQGPILEIADPGTYGMSYATAPEGTIVGKWAAAGHKTRRGTYLNNAEPFFEIQAAYMANSGLYWHEGQQALFMAYEDTYNVSGRPDWGLIRIVLGATSPGAGGTPEGSTTATGPWRIKATDQDGNSVYGTRRAGYFCPHPTTGQMFVGGSLSSGNASGSWGPAMYGGIDWPTASTPQGPEAAKDLVLTKRWLNYYFMGNKIADGELIAPNVLRSFRRRVDPPIWEPDADPEVQLNAKLYTDAIGPTGSWNERDYTGGHIWIQGDTKHGIIVCGWAVGSPSQDETDPHAGHEFYGNGINDWTCSHGHRFATVYPDAPVQNTGPLSFHSFPYLMCYDPAQVLAVENSVNDYTVEPIWFINLDVQFPGFRTCPIEGSKYPTITGFYYDPDTKKLYVMALGADDSTFAIDESALFHVFQFTET